MLRVIVDNDFWSIPEEGERHYEVVSFFKRGDEDYFVFAVPASEVADRTESYFVVSSASRFFKGFYA